MIQHKITSHKYSKLFICLGKLCGLCLVALMSLFPEVALASKFDLDAGVKAATDPIIKVIDDHWGKAVLIIGVGAALLGEGDARQRAVRAGISSTAAGAVILALKAMLT